MTTVIIVTFVTVYLICGCYTRLISIKGVFPMATKQQATEMALRLSSNFDYDYFVYLEGDKFEVSVEPEPHFILRVCAGEIQK